MAGRSVRQLAAALAIGLLLAVVQGAAAQDASAQELTARGVVEPRIEATLSSRIAGLLTSIPADRGIRVARGDELVAFDCAIEKAQLKAARAEAEGARTRLDSLARLERMRSVGKLEVAVARADLHRLEAVVEERQVTVGYCVIVAPFDGLVIDVLAHANENVEAGTPLLSLLDDRSLQLAILAPSDWTAWLAPGADLTFTVDETGERLAARVSQLGARIDATSQVIPVFAGILRAARETGAAPSPLIAGMTGTARFPAPAPAAAR